jgi:hypothetical protein
MGDQVSGSESSSDLRQLSVSMQHKARLHSLLILYKTSETNSDQVSLETYLEDGKHTGLRFFLKSIEPQARSD